jgi:hypothetical protein
MAFACFILESMNADSLYLTMVLVMSDAINSAVAL